MVTFRQQTRRVEIVLNRLPLYRFVLGWLLLLVFVAVLFCLFGVLPYNAGDLVGATALLMGTAVLANILFAKVFGARIRYEPACITALILALIISPTDTFTHLPMLAWAAVLAIASKYVLARRHRHVFNPAAVAVLITSFALNFSASWWVGNFPLLPFVVIGGIVTLHKVRRSNLLWAFFMTVGLTLLAFAIFGHLDLSSASGQIALRSPLFFFAFVMLTDPPTTPRAGRLQLICGALVGFLFLPQVHLGHFDFTPEMALLIGNAVGYVFGPNLRRKAKGQRAVREQRSASDRWRNGRGRRSSPYDQTADTSRFHDDRDLLFVSLPMRDGSGNKVLR